ncbi:hypothetical protein JVU11DRAFT_10107 [Chiua virens]|nr:hypothetical protein JVU11DRAFT_10107 [Chiua virens]
MIQYFTNLTHPTPVPGPSTDPRPVAATKTLQSIYSGVDVWPGRGQYGDSGFCCYRAFTHTSPLGFSTAIFAPGWTWEGVTENPEKNWKTWWENERKFWLGPLKPGEIIPVPDSPEGPFKPATAFFLDLPPPDPFHFTFYANFSPGVGYFWFVKGKKVLGTNDGWTDIDKQSSIGNLVWPWPTPSWHGAEQDEALPTASTTLDMTDGYSGGNTLKLTLVHAGNELENAVKAIWLPVQSLAVTTRESFEARVVYKTIADTDVDFSPYLYVKSLSKSHSTPLTVSLVTITELPYGWTQQVINFTSTSTPDQTTELVAIGFLVDIKPTVPSAQVTVSLFLGQLAIYATPSSQSVSIGTPSITGAKFTPTRHTADPLEGILAWDIASTFIPEDVNVDDKESTTPAWLLHDTPTCRFPKFVYFNVYAVPLDVSVNADPENAVFIGTTGIGGHANRLYVERACFPTGWVEQVGVRFFVQGVTDRGEVLPWERCATVDHRQSRFSRI